MSIKFILLALGIFALMAVAYLLKEWVSRNQSAQGSVEKEKAKYSYTRKQFFMNRSEHDFYDALVHAIGDQYLVFAQVHLSTILDHNVKGQNWKAALSHIDRKSVDFVLCDKAYISPKLAIELDGRSHEREDRVERDVEVERILAEADLPLLRIENHGAFNSDELKGKIKAKLTKQ